MGPEERRKTYIAYCWFFCTQHMLNYSLLNQGYPIGVICVCSVGSVPYVLGWCASLVLKRATNLCWGGPSQINDPWWKRCIKYNWLLLIGWFSLLIRNVSRKSCFLPPNLEASRNMSRKCCNPARSKRISRVTSPVKSPLYFHSYLLNPINPSIFME